MSIELVGPSVGPHLGPGCVGAVVLYRPGGAPAPEGCDKVATTLRTGTIGEARTADLRLYSAPT